MMNRVVYRMVYGMMPVVNNPAVVYGMVCLGHSETRHG